MREYEILVVSEIGDVLHNEARQKTKSILESYKAEIFDDQDFGVHDLSFPIKKVKQGKYFFYHFRFEETSPIPAIEKDLRYEECILRFIIVRLDEVKRKMERSNIKKAKRTKREEAKNKIESSNSNPEEDNTRRRNG